MSVTEFFKLKLLGVAIRILRWTSNLDVVAGPLKYNQDGLATCHNADFMLEPRFAEAYRRGKETGSWGRPEHDIHWRIYIACWVANRARCLEGDFVECGVNKGGSALAVVEYLDFTKIDKCYYLLDTFQGLAEQQRTDEEKKRGENPWGYTECYEEVKETFRGYRNVEIIRGMVPDTLSQVKAEKVAFLLIDMNCAEPEIAAAEYFWPKMTSGAIILLDDYSQPDYYVQKRAFDAFAVRKGIEILSLPTGQGMIVKP